MALKSILARLQARLAARPDTEHEQAIVRLLVVGLFFLYFLPQAFTGLETHDRADLHFVLAMVCTLLLAGAVFGWICLFPASSPARRVAAAVLDAGSITFFMYHTGEYGTPLYIVYLWIIIGNGFRYGKPYLYNSLALSIAGFRPRHCCERLLGSEPHFRHRIAGGMTVLSCMSERW